MHCTSALTIKEKIHLKTMVWALKVKPGGHCGCGFRHILYCWQPEISELKQTKDTTNHSQNYYLLGGASCNIIVSSSSLIILQPFQNPINLCLTITLLPDSSNPNSWNLCNFLLLAFIGLPYFVVHGTQYKCFLNLWLLGYSPQFGSHSFLFLLQTGSWLFLSTLERRSLFWFKMAT